MKAFDKFHGWFSRLSYVRMSLYIALFLSTSMFIATLIVGESIMESLKIWAGLFSLTLIGFAFAWSRASHEANLVKDNVIPFTKPKK